MTATVRVEGSDLSFPAPPGVSVVDAGLRAGVELPHSCRRGVCASCVGRVVHGVVRPIGQVAYRNEACGADEVLLCQCEASGDLTIAVHRARRVDPLAPRRYRARVHRNTLAAPDVSVLELRLPTGQRMKFRAGQYLHVRLEDGGTRSFSMANPPQRNDAVTLHVRHVPQGHFSGRVATLERGDELEIEGPFGSFVLEEDGPAQAVLVAGGTGFAPIHAMLEDLSRRQPERALTLVWGGRTPADLYAPQALQRWAVSLPALRQVRVLEDPQGDGQAMQGRVDDALRALPGSWAGTAVYACGSPGMIEAVRTLCIRTLGVPARHFHFDAFVPGPAG